MGLFKKFKKAAKTAINPKSMILKVASKTPAGAAVAKAMSTVSNVAKPFKGIVQKYGSMLPMPYGTIAVAATSGAAGALLKGDFKGAGKDLLKSSKNMIPGGGILSEGLSIAGKLAGSVKGALPASKIKSEVSGIAMGINDIAKKFQVSSSSKAAGKSGGGFFDFLYDLWPF